MIVVCDVFKLILLVYINLYLLTAFNADGCAQGFELLGDLKGEFPSGCKYEGKEFLGFLEQVVQDGQRESTRFT